MVEVGDVGRREDRRRVEQDRHLAVARAAGRPRAARSTARRATAGRGCCARCRRTGTPASPRARPARSRAPRRSPTSSSSAAGGRGGPAGRAGRRRGGSWSGRSSYDVIYTTVDGDVSRRAPSGAPPRDPRRPAVTRFEPNLRIPGPTALPPVRPRGRRAPDGQPPRRGVQGAPRRVEAGMKPFFGTEHDVILLTCAGTGALEAAVVNTLSPGDPVLAVTMGAFGDRFAKIAEVYGAAVTKLEVEWGRRPSRPRSARPRRRSPACKAVLLTHNETSHRRHQRHRGARRGGPRGRAGRADPRRRDLGARRRAVRDGRVGPRPRRHGLAEGVDVGAGHGDGRGRARAPGPPPRRRRMPRFYLDLKRHRDTAVNGETPVDARRRGHVPGRRGAPPDAGRGRRRLHAPRRVRRR